MRLETTKGKMNVDIATNDLDTSHQFNAVVDDTPGILVQTGVTRLYGWEIFHATDDNVFLQCFDKAALVDVTLGTTVPDYVIVTNGVAKTRSGAQYLRRPIKFTLGLCVFGTTTATGSTAAAQVVSLSYT